MNERYIQANQENFPTPEKQFLSTENEGLFRRTLRGKIALAGAALLLAVFGAKELSHTEAPTIDGTVAATLTIDAGVNLHSSPHMPDPSGESGTNVDYTVPPGVNIKVYNPVQATSMGGTAGSETWFGFDVPGVKGTQWLNDSEVEAQGLATTNYANTSSNLLDTKQVKSNYYFTTESGQQQQAGTSEIVSAP